LGFYIGLVLYSFLRENENDFKLNNYILNWIFTNHEQDISKHYLYISIKPNN
jgi:hypothetical protein